MPSCVRAEDLWRLLEVAPDGIVIHQDGAIVHANQACADQLGVRDHGDLVGREMLDFIASSDRATFERRIERLCRHGEVPEVIRISMVGVDGRRLATDLATTQIVWHGRAAAMSIVRNVTACRQTEEALRQKDEDFRRLIEMTPEAAIVVQDGRIAYTNPAAIEQLGANRSDQVVGRAVADFIVPEDREMIAATYRHLHEIGGSFGPCAFRRLRLDGSVADVETIITRIVWDGRRAILGMIRDASTLRQTEAALKESEARFRHVVETIPDGVIIHQHGLICYINEAAARQSGTDGGDTMIGRSIYDLIVDEDRDGLRRAFDGLCRDGASPSRQFVRRLCIDGGVADMESVSAPTLWAGEAAVISVFRNASEHLRTRTALRDSEINNDRLIEHSQDAIFAYAEGKIVVANTAAVRLLGADRHDDLIGRSPTDFCTPGMLAYGRARISDIENNRAVPCSRAGRWVGLDGRLIDVEWTSVPITYRGRPGAYNLVRDIGPRLEAEAKDRYLASHDVLTKLPNRAGFQSYMKKAVLRARRRRSQIALHFLDLDDFKGINDSLGHPMGDRLLKVVADRLRRVVSDDNLVMRFGGDEFVVVQTDIDDVTDIGEMAIGIRDAVAQPEDLSGHRLYPTVSIGIAVYPKDATSPKDLLRKADMALFKAKDRGRSMISFYTEDMDRRLQRRETLLQDIGEAVRRRDFTLHFQPIADLADGGIRGFEALLRWEHPDHGVLPADRFIDALESSPHAAMLSERLLRFACRQGRKWRDAGLPAHRIAVNLSMNQIKQPDLVDVIAKVLKETGFPAAQLEVELTENVMLHVGVAEVAKTFGQISDLGVGIALDDFGTGYSSLTFLKRFPVSRIKIDRTFVADLKVNPQDVEIVRAVISLGHGLNLCVTAEGVESQAAWDFLRAEGCDEIQGYVLARPMPAQDIPAFLDRRPEMSWSKPRLYGTDW